MTVPSGLGVLERLPRPSVSDSVFDELHRQILKLDLPPGTRMTEIDVARALGVSRQPVRDAFYRLSKLGFLTIRPQRATVVSKISERAVMEARFIRMAVEIETARVACGRLTSADLDDLQRILDQQGQAVQSQDPERFHLLDDQFHQQICVRSGHGFSWELIREKKSHMDRVRFLSLSFASAKAYAEHAAILDAIRQRDATLAAERVRQHLSRIIEQIVRIRAENARYFEDEI